MSLFYIKPSEFKQRVVFQTESINKKNSDGIPQKMWEKYYVDKAKINTVQNTEISQGNGIDSSLTMTLYVRYIRSKPITNEMSVVIEGEFYSIHSVVDIQFQHKYYEIKCRKERLL